MKKNKRVAFCGMISALSLVLLLAAYFPYLTYALPAVAGMLFSVIVLEINKKYAFAAYFCTALIAFFICEKESSVLFILFFGYYPIIKAVFESFKSRILEYLLKLITFNISFSAAYILLIFVFNLPLEFVNKFGVFILPVLFIGGNVIFLFYDFALSRVIGAYSPIIHKGIKKIFY